MATASERLALVITANGSQAVTELTKVGTTARTQLGAAEKSMDRIGTGMVNAGGAKVAAGGAVAVTAMFAAANAAQGLADSIGKAEDVFGSSVNLTAYSERAAESMALSKEAALDAASAYGLLLKQSGVGGSASPWRRPRWPSEPPTSPKSSRSPTRRFKSDRGRHQDGQRQEPEGATRRRHRDRSASLAGLDTAAKTTKVYEEILRQTADAQNTVKNSGDDIGVRAAVAQAKLDNAIAEIGGRRLPS